MDREKNDLTSRVVVEGASQVGEARRLAAILADQLGFSPHDAGRAAIVVVEAATNLTKHATGGEILLTPHARSSPPCLEIAAVDKGPGMERLEENLVDGFSSAGTPGTGLGAIVRQSDRSDLYSQAGIGTAVWARVCERPPRAPAPPARLDIGAVNIPRPGETVSGDAWGYRGHDTRQVLLVTDGLGHGPDASRASQQALAVFDECAFAGPVEVLRRCHEGLVHTRGAAAAVVELDVEQGRLRFAGVGNIRCMVLGRPPLKNLASNNGALGLNVRHIEESGSAWEPGSLLLIATDGMVSSMDVQGLPGLASRAPGLVAAVLSRFYRRDTDDALILVARDRLEAS